MNDLKVLPLPFLLGIIIILFSIAFLVIRKENKEERELMKEYPELEYDSSLNGIVVSKFDFRANGYRDFGYICRITIGGDECLKYTISAEEINWGDTRPVNALISVGDTIRKKSNNDTIFITKKNGKVFRFLLED